MGIIKIFLIFIFLIGQCFSQYSELVKKEYFGMYKYRFEPLQWKITKVDTHWLSKWERVYMGETWRFRTTEQDTVGRTKEEIRYFFHGGQQLTAIQFITFSYDSLIILETMQKYAEIVRNQGHRGFNPDLVNGGQWPGPGGPTTSLCKVYRIEVYIPGSNWRPKYHGSLVVDFAYHYYSIIKNWSTGVEPYYISLNFYPYQDEPLPDPGYDPDLPSELLFGNPDGLPPIILNTFY